MFESCDVTIISSIYDNFQQAGIWISETLFVKLTFSLELSFYSQSLKNRIRKSLI